MLVWVDLPIDGFFVLYFEFIDAIRSISAVSRQIAPLSIGGYFMPIYRSEKSSNYTVVSNYALRDKRISLKAKGLLVVLLS